MGRQLPDGAEVRFLGALAESCQLEVLVHPLAGHRGHVLVLSQRVKKPPLRGTFGHSVDRCQSRADRWEYR